MSKIQLPRKSAALVPQDMQLFHTKQINAFWQQTPDRFVKDRPAKGGGSDWKYVTGSYIKSQLDRVFAYNWSFEVKSHEVIGSQVIVQGKLTAFVPYKVGEELRFHAIVKEDFGRADIKLKKVDKKPLDVGNDFKAATTDALKRCAVQFGIARDIYSSGEMREIEFVDQDMLKEEKAGERLEKMEQEADQRLEALGDSYEVNE